nr:hypothetical protein [Tanacetum cinerariifolium]
MTLLWMLRRMHLNKRKIAELDADEDVTLVDVDTAVEMDADIQERMEEDVTTVKEINVAESEPTVFDDKEVRPIFEREYNMVQTFLKPNRDEEPAKKRGVEETLLQESFKKLRAEVEVSVAELKVEALQVKYPIINWEIYSEGSRTYWKIIRVGGITQAYRSFEDMLKDFDREDLDALWRITKQKFSTTMPTEDKEKALLIKLKRLYEPNAAEKDYPLTDAILLLMLSTKLQVDEDCEMARDLVMKIFMEANKPKSKRSLDTYYSLWEVILNGDCPTPTRIVDGVVQVIAPTTVEQRLDKKNELKARGILLMALPDKHQLKFNIHKDAKSLMEAIEKRFRGNKETKKVQKTLLKQQYENFSGITFESLDQIHDRLQKRIHTSIWRNKADLENQSLDDLFNNLKIYEAEVKSSSNSSQTTLNIAFVSSNNNDSTNETVNVVPSVFIASSKALVSTLPNMDSLSDAVIYSFFAREMAMLTMRARKFLQKTGRNLGANGTAAIGFDMSKVECYNCHRRGHFARDCRSPKDNSNKDTPRRTVPVEVSTSNALMSQCDGVGSDNEVAPCSKACSKAYATLQSHYDKLTVDFRKSQFDVLSYKIGYDNQVFNSQVFDCDEMNSSESDDSVPTSQVHDRYKSGERYNAVPPPYTGTFMPSKPDLVFNDAPNASKTIPDVVIVESSSTKPSKDLSKTLRPDAPIIEDWTSDSEDESKMPVEHTKLAENLRTNNQKYRGHKHSLNKKSCFVCKSLNHLIKDCDYYEKQMVQKPVWNNALRVNHHPSARMSHPYSNRNVIPTAVLTRSGLVSLHVARPISTAVPQTTMKSPKPVKHAINKAHSPIRRPINHRPSPKNSNFHKKVTTVKVSKVNVVQGTKGNWVWKPKCIVLDHFLDSQGNPQQALKDKGVIDSGCSRHMTENISYLSYFKEINGGYVAFGGNPKGGKITGKGIKREFSVARTLQHNRVAERKNRTLIEAARTMLADSLLPIFFWAEAVNTACYVQNRVLVTKLHNKTPYELLLGRTPRSGAKWFFDINTLTQSMNYRPVVINLIIFSQDPQNTDVDVSFDVKENKVRVSPRSSDKPKKYNEKAKREAKGKSPIDLSIEVRDLSDEFEEFSFNRSNRVNATNAPVIAVGLNPTNNTNSFNAASPFDNAFSLNFEIDDEEDIGVEADFSNLETNISVSSILTTRVHKDHLVSQIIGELTTSPQTRRMARMEEGIDYEEVFAPIARIEAIWLFLAFASFMGFMVYKVVKALYGLHQAPRAWYETLANYLLENGFQKGNFDQKLFLKKQKRDILLVHVYVDDIIFRSTNKKLRKAFKKLIKDKFQMSSMGELTFFRITNAKLASTPIDTEKPLLKDPDGEDVDVHIYRDYARASLDRKSTTGGCQFLVDVKDGVGVTAGDLKLLLSGILLLLATALIKMVNDVIKLQALTDRKKVVITEDIIWQDLQLDDTDGLPRTNSVVPWPRLSSTLPQEQPTGTSMTLVHTLMETCVTLSQKVAHLEQDKIAQALEIIKLKQRGGIEAIDVDEDITLVDIETKVDLDAKLQGRIERKDDDNAVAKEDNDAEPTVFDDEEVTMTMAQTLINMKAKKARILDEQMAKRLHDEEVEQATAREKQEKYDFEKAKEVPKSKEETNFCSLSEEKHDSIFEEYGWDVEDPLKKKVTEETMLQESFKKLRAVKVPEKDYPLTDDVMILMLSTKLQVDEDCEMARDLIMKIFMKANKPKSKRSLDTSSK